MLKSYKSVSTKQTPVDKPVLGEKQVQNHDGAYVFEVSKWQRLDRFLVLGTEHNTFYDSGEKLTLENAQNLVECLKEDGKKTVDRIVEVSDKALGIKNDPCEFALAVAAADSNAETRAYALSKLNTVCRISTQLFHFNAFVEQFRGRGRTLNTAVKNWYQSKTPDQLAYQLVKYQNRDGWSHRDLLRLCKPVPKSIEESSIYKWAVGKMSDKDTEVWHRLILGFENAKQMDKPNIKLIQELRLEREMLPTTWLNSPDVWAAMLPNLKPTAIIRNLGKMSAVGLLAPMSDATKYVCGLLTDKEVLKKARIHPMQLFVALKIYEQGHGDKGKLSWKVTPQIIDTLDSAVYLAFDNVAPTNKNYLVGVDVSGSMRSGPGPVAPCETAAMLASIIARTENNYFIHGFCDRFVDLGITKKQRLDDVVRSVQKSNFGATNCSLPMNYALDNKIPVDVFVVITDNEVNIGDIQPFQALNRYRDKTGRDAKMIVLACTPTKFSIAKPGTNYMLDIVGASADTPTVIRKFSLGEI